MKQGMAILFVLGCATAALAQDSKPDVAKTLDGYVSRVEKEFAGAADAMPEDKYSFAPTNGEFRGAHLWGTGEARCHGELCIRGWDSGRKTSY